jgi:hypothetical protein
MREQHVNPLVSAQAADLPATVGHLAQRHTNPTNHTRNKISDRAVPLTVPLTKTDTHEHGSGVVMSNVL